MKRLLTALVLAVTVFPPMSARAEDKVDRERLLKLLPLPAAGRIAWYYTTSSDGRCWEGGEEPREAGIETLRARAEAADDDAQPWLDLASAYRRHGAPKQQAECVAHGVEILRRRVKARADDGESLAALGLALAAAGDTAGANDAVGHAEAATRGAWAGTAASAELMLVWTAGETAGRRFCSSDEISEWIAADAERAASLDPMIIESVGRRLGEAILEFEKAGVSGPPAARVHLLRQTVTRWRYACAPKNEAPADRQRLLAWAEAEQQAALRLLAPDPLALTMIALHDAMSEPIDARGARVVQGIDKLSEAARAKFEANVAKLREIAKSPDSSTAARALQGIACLQWFVLGDAAATEATLRQSIARDAGVPQSWRALAFVLEAAQRWDDVVKLSTDWIAEGDSSEKRILLSSVLATSGRVDDAEKEWRAALALDPKSVVTQLGLIGFVVRHADADAAIAEAKKLVRAAYAALPPSADESHDNLAAACGLFDAIVLGLAGEIDACEKTARHLLDEHGEFPAASEVLAAIGR